MSFVAYKTCARLVISFWFQFKQQKTSNQFASHQFSYLNEQQLQAKLTQACINGFEFLYLGMQLLCVDKGFY